MRYNIMYNRAMLLSTTSIFTVMSLVTIHMLYPYYGKSVSVFYAISKHAIDICIQLKFNQLVFYDTMITIMVSIRYKQG
jgi:hypothetical protein